MRKKRMEAFILKSILEHHDLLIAMMFMTSATILLKCLCAIKYQILIKEVEQISSSKNHILRSMIMKYESSFKLKMPVKNTESFIKVYQENFRLFGIPLNNLENFDLFCGFFVFCMGLINIMGGIYYQLPSTWILIQLMTFSVFLIFLILSEFVFQPRKKGRMLILQLTHYFDNTLYTRFFQKYIHPVEHAAYLREYFEPLTKKNESYASEKPAATLEPSLAEDMKELALSLMTEKEAEKLLEEKRKQLEYASTEEDEEFSVPEKYRLLEEIIKEYL